MAKERCLLIGGAGFIGRHLVESLHSIGREVTVLSRRDSADARLCAECSYVKGDFSDLSVLAPLLDTHEEVIHLAYATVPNTSFADPLADLLGNLPPAVQLFEQLAKRGSKLIYVSSGGTVYGNQTVLPIPETAPTNPISPYGVTKLTLEKYAALYRATHGLNVVIVRPANAYGPGQKPFSGQGFIASAIGSVLKGDPIKIFGAEGTLRDYVHVQDLADGITAALVHGMAGEVYNIGTGQGISNLEMVKILTPIMQEISYKPEVLHLPDRVFDVKANVLDSTKIKIETGWQPKVPLVEGLRLTRDWLRGQFEK
jgi:UDP-glucose 4-epimerase